MDYLLFCVLYLYAFKIGWITLGIIFIIAIVIIITYFSTSAKKEKKLDEERNKRLAKEWNEYRIKKENEYNENKKALLSQYGSPVKSIIIKERDLNNEILVFETAKRIWICGNDYPMKAILNCTYSDNPRVVKGKITSTTKTNTGSMVKRAVVGDVLLGSTGAIIGGATASKTTVSTQENDKIHHDYTVIINVDSLSNPIVKIPLGEDVKTADEIVGMMNVIISRQ